MVQDPRVNLSKNSEVKILHSEDVSEEAGRIVEKATVGKEFASPPSE